MRTTVEATKAQLKAAETQYSSARRRYEDHIRDQQKAVRDAWTGTRVGRAGGASVLVNVTTWTLTVGKEVFDVAGATADISETDDEKRPVRINIRDAAGRPYSATFADKHRSRAEEIARKIISQGKWAAANAQERQEDIARAMTAFAASIAHTSTVWAAASSYATVANLSEPPHPEPRQWTVAEVRETKANALIEDATSWLPGVSPTVRRDRIKRISLGIGGALLAGALIAGCFAVGIAENRSAEREREEQAIATESRADRTPSSFVVPSVLGDNLGTALDEHDDIQFAWHDLAPALLRSHDGDDGRAVLLPGNWRIVAQCDRGDRLNGGTDVTIGVVKDTQSEVGMLNAATILNGGYNVFLGCR